MRLQAIIGKEKLRRLLQAFAKVRRPGGLLADKKLGLEQGQVPLQCGLRDAGAALGGFRVAAGNKAGNEIGPRERIALGKISGKQAINGAAVTPIQFTLRQRPELDDFHTVG